MTTTDAGGPQPTPSTHDGRRHGILAIDTATTRIVIATGSPDGVPDGLSTWPAGYRHGETLLPAIGRFLGEQNLRRSRLDGIIVGTGPGAFTGLRVGIATAKGLALGLGIPLVGVSTAEALISAAAGAPWTARSRIVVLLQPAGPSDRVADARRAARRSCSGARPSRTLRRGRACSSRSTSPSARPTTPWRAARPPRPGLGAALLALGAPRLPAATREDLADLVPEYVTLPRGATPSDGAVTWSHDLR